jgi:(R,R)-butanediol dehydrogenase/meso-butanediol dehydrogenase/diacetyl reductase
VLDWFIAHTEVVEGAFGAAGASLTVAGALRITECDGTVSVLSLIEAGASMHPDGIMQAERRLVGSFGYNGGPLIGRSEFKTALEMMNEGRIDPEPFITGTMALSETEEAFEHLLEADSNHIKILIEP